MFTFILNIFDPLTSRLDETACRGVLSVILSAVSADFLILQIEYRLWASIGTSQCAILFRLFSKTWENQWYLM